MPDNIAVVTRTGALNASVKSWRLDVLGLAAKLAGGPDFGGSIFRLDTPLPTTLLRGDVDATLATDVVLTLENAGQTLPATVAGGQAVGRMMVTNPCLTVRDVALQIYALWGIEITDPATLSLARGRICAWINSAMQEIYANADRLGGFNRGMIELDVSATGWVTLDSNVKSLVGHVRMGGRNLRALKSLEELENYAAWYYDGTTVPDGPRAYFVETIPVEMQDSLELRLHVTPAPLEETPCTLQVCFEPPRYAEGDILFGRDLALPHRHAEGLLLPIVKQWALADSLCVRREELKEQIFVQYQKAMSILGGGGPLSSSAPAISAPNSMPQEAAA